MDTKMNAVSGKISFVDENGNVGYTGFILPKCILDELQLRALQWKDNYEFTFKEIEQYLSSLEKLGT